MDGNNKVDEGIVRLAQALDRMEAVAANRRAETGERRRADHAAAAKLVAERDRAREHHDKLMGEAQQALRDLDQLIETAEAG